jgi:Rrf2 family protein
MLSKKTQNAFIYLAQHQNNGPVLIAKIARKKNIPLKFLENILLELRKAGILESKKGKGDGYLFNNPPSTIPLEKVLRTVEGPIALLPCVSLNFSEKCKDCQEEICGLNKVMIEVRYASLKILEGKTVADLAMLE